MQVLEIINVPFKAYLDSTVDLSPRVLLRPMQFLKSNSVVQVKLFAASIAYYL